LDIGAFKFMLITACILFCFISLLGSTYHIKIANRLGGYLF
jgi:hypothetical protein